MKFRLLSYNIHKAIGGVDRRYRPERIIDVIHGYCPDIVFLQEVDDGVPRSAGDRQVDLFGDALDMPARAWQGNVSLRRGEYGNAILSRFALANVEDLDLSIRFKKRRRALLATVMPAGDAGPAVLLANCHLGLAEFERRTQARRLAARLDEAAQDDARGAMQIVGGDLNDVWASLGRLVLEPGGFHPAPGSGATFPAVRPLRGLDRLFLRGGLRAVHGFVGHSALARRASDHLPLVADFEIPAAGARVAEAAA